MVLLSLHALGVLVQVCSATRRPAAFSGVHTAVTLTACSPASLQLSLPATFAFPTPRANLLPACLIWLKCGSLAQPACLTQPPHPCTVRPHRLALGPVTLPSPPRLPLRTVPCCLLQVYSATTQPLIQKVVGGFNSTVFAYGQTSSGKTHTMRGTEQEPGIIPLAVREIFDHIGSMQDREFLLRVSYMEVCNPCLLPV